MCTNTLRKVLVSPISSSTGRAALLGGATGVYLDSQRRKAKRKAAAAAAAAGPPAVLEPTQSLNNSSLFNR